MPILNPDHLLDQAERLVAAPAHGPPRQADLRRAISTAYYAVFHACLTAVADAYVGVTLRTTSRYALVYRSIDHRTLKELCEEARKSAMKPRFLPHIPPGGFDAAIRAFCMATIELQQARHAADYDPLPRFQSSDALVAIRAARQALGSLDAAPAAHRQAFLALLAFPPRGQS